MLAITTLKHEVKRLAYEGRVIRANIGSSHGLERYELWNQKRAVGTVARHVLLAYACLRGQRYEDVEPRCRQGNEPSATAVFEAMKNALNDDLKATWSPEPVRAWLQRKPIVEAVAA